MWRFENTGQREPKNGDIGFPTAVSYRSCFDVRHRREDSFQKPKDLLKKKKDPLLGIQKQDRELQFVMFKY